jgi:hypothetical protein
MISGGIKTVGFSNKEELISKFQNLQQRKLVNEPNTENNNNSSNNNNDNNNENEKSSLIAACEHPLYVEYFNQLKRNVMLKLVQSRMIKAGLDPEILNTPNKLIPRQ